MMDLGTRCADIVGGAVLLRLWPGEHLAVAMRVFIGVSATPGAVLGIARRRGSAP